MDNKKIVTECEYDEALYVYEWHMSDKSEIKKSSMTIEQSEEIIYLYNNNK